MTASSLKGVIVIAIVLLTVLGLLGVMYYHRIFVFILEKNLPLAPSSLSFQYFKNPPADILIAFRFFNVTNPDSVVFDGVKPIVEEIGPYYYKHRYGRENLSFNEDETELFFEQRKYYEFDAENSVGSEDDTFMSLDIVGYLVARGAYEEGAVRFVAKTLSTTKRNYPFKNYKIKEFLFGVDDILLKKALPLKFPDPANRPPPKFGILMDMKTGESMHGRFDYNFTVNTGKKDLSNYLALVNFAGIEQLSLWPNNTNLTSDPNEIRGTLGTGFAPGIDKNTVLSFFTEDICLSFDISYVKSTTFGPIEAFRFGIEGSKWRSISGTLNRAFCSPDDRADPVKCMQNGVFNSTSCKGNEAGVSLPHMLFADELYQNTVVGMKPDLDKHNVFIDVDPVTGATLNGAKRAQLNIPLKRFNYKLYKNLPYFTMMPIMWSEETAKANSAAIESLQFVHILYTILKIIAYAMLIIGLTSMLIMTIVYVVTKRRSVAHKSGKLVMVKMNTKANGNGYAEKDNLLS